MKIKTFILLLLTGFVFTTCDKIDPPYSQAIVPPDTNHVDSVVIRKILVEDYTGHLCGNCPAAGVFLNDQLKPIYNNSLVVISVHAGFFAGPCPNSTACLSTPHPAGSFTTDFNSAPGTVWNTFFGISGNPKGMVNRIDYPSSTHSKGYQAWAPAIDAQVNDTPKIKMTITNNFNSASNSVNVSVVSDFLENLTGNHLLQVVITEDSLTDWQLWYGNTPETVDNYLHRHVLRDGLNTTWGETIVTGSVNAGVSVTKNYNYTINSAWNVNHCNIVAFIYDATTYEVIQVEEAPVK